MAKWNYRIVQRDCICRKCESIIQKGNKVIELEGVHVSPKTVNLFFHAECIADGIKLIGDKH